MSGAGGDGKGQDLGRDMADATAGAAADSNSKIQAACDDIGKSEPSLLTKVVEGTKSTIAGAADYVKKVVG